MVSPFRMKLVEVTSDQLNESSTFSFRLEDPKWFDFLILALICDRLFKIEITVA
jgi:hypothetical protein